MRSWVWLALLTTACNQALGLEATSLPPPDEDRDGVADADDVCPTVLDPAQVDTDGDGFGDACDRCPALRTDRNHDEDGDRRGDDCDACPVEPEFGEDYDQDGVGDLCEFGPEGPTELVWFDPFVTTDARYRSTGVGWAMADDAIAPVAHLPADDPGLALDAIVVTHARFKIEIGVRAARPWSDGDAFAVALFDGSTELARCGVSCSSTGCLARFRTPRLDLTAPVPPRPVTTAELIQQRDGIVCLAAGTSMAAASAPAVRGHPVLFGSPAIAIAYLGIWGEND